MMTGTERRISAERERGADVEDLVASYLADISKHQLLTKEDEIELAQAIEDGKEAREELESGAKISPRRRSELDDIIARGEAAQTRFINANLRLVVSVAKKYGAASGMELLDLIQEGNFGLMHALEKFDWRRGFKFSTYATWWIRQAVTRGMANNSRTIRLPVHVGDLVYRVAKARSEIEGRTARKATPDEVAEATGLSLDQVMDVMSLPTSLTSLNQSTGEDGDAELGDFIEDESTETPFDAAARAMVRNDVRERLLGRLTDRESKILSLRYGLEGDGIPRTLEEVGADFNLTRERIRQIETRALSKLRHPSLSIDPESLVQG